MTAIANNVLQQALTVSSAERAWLAHCLIASIEQQPDESVEAEWLALARQGTGVIQ